MSTQKDFIDNIINRYTTSDKEFVLDSLAGSIDRIQKSFPRYGSFLMEFIQNADDAKSKAVRFELLQNNLIILNDGDQFSEENVSSICKVGRSSKTPKDYIGYLGVGFKSVFLMSDSVEINSGGFRFKFSKKEWDDPTHTPWQVVPIWILDSHEKSKLDKFHTLFDLCLKGDKTLLDGLEEEMKPTHLNDRILLFLRYLEKMEIQDNTRDYNRTIEKELKEVKSSYEVYVLREREGNSITHIHNWLVFRSDCPVPKKVTEDLITKEWERETVQQRQVVVAFRLDDTNQLMVEEKGTAHIGVFSFLPMKEIPSGLNFLIQADFLTMPGRGELHRDCLWNQWLAKEIYNLITNICIPTFLGHKTWKLNFTEILHSTEGGHELFEKHIKGPLRDYLSNNALVITEDNSCVKPEDAIFMNQDLKNLLGANDIKVLYPGKGVVHPAFKAPWEITTSIEDEPTFNATVGLSDKMEQLLTLKAEQKDVSFFVGFYRLYLLKYKDSSSASLSKLSNYDVLLTDTFELANAKAVYIKSASLTIPENIRSSFKIVHPKLTQEADILEFLKTLDVSELTQEHIQELLKKEKLPEISQNWANLSEAEKIQHIEFFKEQWEKGLDVKDLSFLTFKTSNGQWLKPQEILFSKEYNPEHRIETLRDEFVKWIEEGTLDIDEHMLGMPTEFLSNEFIKGCDDQEVRKWSAFFRQTGVDAKLKQEDTEDKKGFSQRIGILMSLHYEKIKGRKAKELGESQKPGYDIESEERVIEVKGRSSSNPNIFITTNELKAMQKNKNYFVYVVSDTLRHPVLTLVSGEELLGITDIQIIVPYKKWSSVKYDELQI